QKKHPLVLLLVIVFFTYGKAQQSKLDSLLNSQPKFTYGIKANVFLFTRLPGFTQSVASEVNSGTDYSVYFKYKSVGVFGGYTALFSFNNDALNTNAVFNCTHFGISYRFFQFSKTGAITLYFYDIRGNQSRKYENGMGQFAYYTENVNFIVANPRYTGTFLNGMLTVEAGVFFGALRDNLMDLQGLNSTNYPAIGANAALALNVSALLAKK
ncbi:MAG TPA: hypothetical protein VNX01_14510, partial [Bacteroidia bacterium]|nr:hypothetical protein [Bacteroidia bacterium]